MLVLIVFLFVILFVLENSFMFCASFSIGFVMLLEMYTVLNNVPAATAVAREVKQTEATSERAIEPKKFQLVSAQPPRNAMVDPDGDGAKPARKPPLTMESPIVDAPAIGPKTATKFHELGLNTVRDFIRHDAESMAAKLNTRWITASLVSQWQDQARLACQIERISAAGSGLLVLAGIRTAQDLAWRTAPDTLSLVHAAAQTAEGKRLLREQAAPPLKAVQRWVNAAKSVESNA